MLGEKIREARTVLSIARLFLRRELKLLTYFNIPFIMGLVDLVSNLLVYALMASLVGRSASIIVYGGDFVTFVMLGVIFNSLLATAMAAPRHAVMSSIGSGRLEVFFQAPISLPSLILCLSLGAYMMTLINIMVYSVTGFAVFGISVGAGANYGLAFLTLVLAILALTGLGLLSAGMIGFLEIRYGDEPLNWAVELISGFASGAFYPIHLLPLPLQYLASLIPHTYALDAARRALLGSGSTLPTLPIHSVVPYDPIVTDMAVLVFLAALFVPVGWKAFKSGFEKCRKDGRLQWWQ